MDDNYGLQYINKKNIEQLEVQKINILIPKIFSTLNIRYNETISGINSQNLKNQSDLVKIFILNHLN